MKAGLSARRIIAVLAQFVMAAALLSAQQVDDNPRVTVGPNILVHGGAQAPQTEPILAGDSADDKRLVGASIVSGETRAGFICRVFYSEDGGNLWRTSYVPEQEEIGGADPQTAFGLHGTAYFAAIAAGSLDTPAALYFYRSRDGGRSWEKGVNLGPADHEEIVADTSAGKYSGRVYVSFTRMVKDGLAIHVTHSEDEGRTFRQPVVAANHPGFGVNATNLQVFSDGSVFVPFITFPTSPTKTENQRGLEFVISTDGGNRFSPPTRILDYHHPDRAQLYREYRSGSVVQYTFPEFAIDRSSGSFRDRVYLLWSDVQAGRARVLFSFSQDRGQHWSPPRDIHAVPGLNSAAFQPAIAVNNQGIVGVEWFETRDRRHADSFDLYFAASRDGGSSFTAPVRVSSQTSFPQGNNNLAPFAMESREKGSMSLYFLSPLNRWSGGGDYIGLAADARGVFHAFWPDARDGTYQVYTAAIMVGNPPRPSYTRIAPANVTENVEFVFERVSYDAGTRETIVPVRIRNISSQTLYPPMRVKINALKRPDLTEQDAGSLSSTPVLLNASNTEPGAGATFDYSRALGSLKSLPPGAVSDVVRWKMRLQTPFLTTFYVNAEVQASVEPK